jgi:hypothetical protein
MSRVTDEIKLTGLQADCPKVEVRNEHVPGGWRLTGVKEARTVIEIKKATLAGAVDDFKRAYAKADAGGMLR